MSVRLDEETETLLRRLARSTGRTKSWVVREAVVEYAAQREQATRPAYGAFFPSLGVVETGHGTLSENTGERFAATLKARRRGRRAR